MGLHADAASPMAEGEVGLHPAAALVASLEPLLERRVKVLVSAGEGRLASEGSFPHVPASRLVWSLMDWIDGCLAAGFGLRAVRDAIVKAAERRLEGFRLGYGTLKIYRVHYGKQMQGGAKGRMHAETGEAPSPSLMPSPAAAKAARAEQPADVGRGVGGRIERVVAAVGYGTFGTGASGLQRARLGFRAASRVVELIREPARRVVARAFGGASAASAQWASPMVTAIAPVQAGHFEVSPPKPNLLPGLTADDLERLHLEELAAKDRAFAARAGEVYRRRCREGGAPVAKPTASGAVCFEVSPPKPPMPNLPPGLTPDDFERLHLEEMTARDLAFATRAGEIYRRRRREGDAPVVKPAVSGAH